MTQIIITFVALFILIAFMSLGVFLTGKPMRRSCGAGSGGDKNECLLCDRGKKSENCPT
ncbi:MAG: DUF539 domain-containing protein [Planctomycetes bacterium]|nr:DUF539 domain-containing protein [Planctomycetota bacterium]